MHDCGDPGTGAIVYLLAELRSEERGAVHEIGSRARVLSTRGDRADACGHGLQRRGDHQLPAEPCRAGAPVARSSSPHAARGRARGNRLERRDTPSAVGIDSLGAELVARPGGLPEVELEAPQDRRRLRELHLVVLHDLDEVAPRIAKVETTAAEDLDSRRLERPPRRVLVVDDEPEVAVLVGRLRAPLRERDELVAHVDERHPVRAAAQRELEQLTVERERLVDVADLERDVIDPHEPSLWHDDHCSRP